MTMSVVGSGPAAARRDRAAAPDRHALGRRWFGGELLVEVALGRMVAGQQLGASRWVRVASAGGWRPAAWRRAAGRGRVRHRWPRQRDHGDPAGRSVAGTAHGARNRCKYPVLEQSWRDRTRDLAPVTGARGSCRLPRVRAEWPTSGERWQPSVTWCEQSPQVAALLRLVRRRRIPGPPGLRIDLTEFTVPRKTCARPSPRVSSELASCLLDGRSRCEKSPLGMITSPLTSANQSRFGW